MALSPRYDILSQMSHRAPPEIRRLQADAVHEFVKDLGYSLSSAALLIRMDYGEFRRLASGHDVVTPYHISRLLLLHDVELETIAANDRDTVLIRQWYRTRALVNGVGAYWLERSRNGRSGRKWRAAPDVGSRA